MRPNLYLAITAFCFTGLLQPVSAQTPVNGYAKVTAIAGTLLTVSNVSETFDTFEDGEYVIVMQVQDNVIGANTGNSATFGNLSAIGAAGLYEVARIASHTESMSLPVTITLTSALANSYNINANSSIQIISFPVLGSPNYTTASAISAVSWDGNRGGVVAFWVQGVFTMAHNITATGNGFRGGVKNTPNGYSACDATTYRTGLATRYAGKGEGIYKATNVTYAAGRGKILNGGGGGNDVNAGGAGGGNYSAGGDGGIGWVPAGTGCSPGVGGLGGISLSGQIAVNRVFMGGGGGGGHENDGLGTAGGNGGGIIFIKANSIVTTGTCGLSIAANGSTAANASNDGSGGAGAGGSIVLEVGSYSFVATCPVAISASGGNGGSSVTTGAHGGGGGGGQGVVYFSGTQPTTNVTTNTNAGTGGSSCSSCPASANGIGGTGPNNSGIFSGSSGPLPVELIQFTAAANGNQVDLNWITATEINNDYFVIERSDDAGRFTEIAQVDGAGNTTAMQFYKFTDLTPQPGVNYYRLRQHDFNGDYEYSGWVQATFKPATQYVKVYPNPAEDQLLRVNLIGFAEQQVTVNIYDMAGRLVRSESSLFAAQNGELSIRCESCLSGIYQVQVVTAERSENLKVIFR